MIWIAPSEKDTDNAALEKRLWDAADQFRANSGLKSQEYARREQTPLMNARMILPACVAFLLVELPAFAQASADFRDGYRWLLPLPFLA